MHYKGRYESRQWEQRGDDKTCPPINWEWNFRDWATQLPNLILRAGDHAPRRFVEFFAATIHNRNSRSAYFQAIGQFCRWCESRRLELDSISPLAVATYVENLSGMRSDFADNHRGILNGPV
jgi:hypothetical protein